MRGLLTDYPLLLATPLETIAALLLYDDTEVETSYGESTTVRLKTIQSSAVFRVAVLALRLAHADAELVAEHRRIGEAIAKLKEQREAVGEKATARSAPRLVGFVSVGVLAGDVQT